MKSTTKTGIIVGASILGAIILIGVIGWLIKFCIRRCRRRAWSELHSLPKHVEVSTVDTNYRGGNQSPLENDPLCPPSPDGSAASPSNQLVVTVNENSVPNKQKRQEQKLTQFQRDRLNRLKEQENHLRPMIRSSHDEEDFQRAIDSAQREFEDSVAKARAQ